MEISGFLIALTLAFFSYFIAKSLKLPALAILLLVASLVGPYGFSLVKQEEIEAFSSIGIMFLLYMIGLEFKTSSIIKYGSRGFVFALIKMSLVSLPIYFISIYFFNLSSLQSFLLSIGLSITSTAIFSQLAKSFGVFRSSSTKQLFAELVWEDVFAVFLLILISAYVNTGDIELSFITSLAFFTVPYFLVRKISEKLVVKLPRDTEVYFLFSLAIAGVLVVISSAMDVPIELAAFLAGSIAANFKEIEKVKKNLNILSSTFIIFFFFSLGMEANLSIFLNPLLITFVLIVLTINALFKAFSTSLISLILNYTPRTAAFSGLLMMSVGEFSLLLAKETAPLFQNFDIFSLISGVVFLSSILSWYFPSFFPKYAYSLSILSKHFSSARKRKTQFLFSMAYSIRKLKGDVFVNLINTFRMIEGQVMLTILLLLVSGYSSRFVPSYLSPFISKVSALLALIIFISSLIYIIREGKRTSKYNIKL